MAGLAAGVAGCGGRRSGGARSTLQDERCSMQRRSSGWHPWRRSIWEREGLERGEAEEEDGRRRQGAGLRVNGGDEADEVAVGGHGARARPEELGGSGARGWKKLRLVEVLGDADAGVGVLGCGVSKEELVLLVAARGGLQPSRRRCTGGKEQRRRLGLLLIQRAREAAALLWLGGGGNQGNWSGRIWIERRSRGGRWSWSGGGGWEGWM